MKKVSPFKFFNVYAFGPIGRFGPILKDKQIENAA